ncbi:MAG: hypothetical protein HFE77_06340 [Clostridiales bacterium]|nr:hypothetical protein [Clostridiales bacterium]
MSERIYKNEDSELHKKHRQRVKEKFRKTGFESFSEIEILEMALFFAKPQGDTNPLAHQLINRFGSLSAVFDASYNQLREVPGIGENAATFLMSIVAFCRAYRLDKIMDDNVFESEEKIGRYLMAYFMGEHTEKTVILCFDRRRRLLGCETVFAEGMDNMSSAKIRRVAELALAHKAAAVVMAHNHPSGIVEPSEFDMASTNGLKASLSGVGIHFIEHYVVTNEDYLGIIKYMEDFGYGTSL